MYVKRGIKREVSSLKIPQNALCVHDEVEFPAALCLQGVLWGCAQELLRWSNVQ